MRWLHWIVFLLPFALLIGCSTSSEVAQVETGTAPPVALIQENCQKSQVIIQGKVVAVRDGHNAYSSALVRIERVYKGTFQPADTLRYYSFREEKYDPARVGQSFIVFLTAKQENGAITWGTATDLAEFSYNAATEKLLLQELK